MSRPPAINADGRFVFCNELAKTARRLQSRRITRARRRAGVVRHRDCLKTSVAGRLMTAVPNDVGQISKILSSCVGWAKRQRAHHPRRARDGGHGASAPLSTLRNSVWGSLAKTICHSDFNLIWVVQSLLAKIFRFLRRANQFYQLAPSFPGKRGASRSSRTRDGMRWTRQRRRARWSQGEVELVSGSRRAGRTALVAYGKTVWSWHPLLMSSQRRCVGPTGLGQVLIRWRR